MGLGQKWFIQDFKSADEVTHLSESLGVNKVLTVIWFFYALKKNIFYDRISFAKGYRQDGFVL